MSVNKVILVGNVGKDPETRYLDETTAISKFPMATSETYKNRSGERVSTTEWHNIVLWRGLAQVAEKYVRKGTQIYIEGRIKTRSYDDADGNKKYITEIVGDQMQLLGRRPDDSEGGQFSPQSSEQSQPVRDQSEVQTPPNTQGQPSSQDQSQSQNQSAAQDQPPAKDDGGADDPFDGADNGPDDLPF
jgi:single-strand DNA-binding protein